MDVRERMMELGLQGFECSQILMMLILEMEEMENPDLIRAMSGLTGGMGHSGGICGALTGGCCVLGMLAGKGDPYEMEHNQIREILEAYLQWFQEEIEPSYGSNLCRDMVQGDYSRCMTVCMPIVEACFDKLMEIAQQYDLVR